MLQYGAPATQHVGTPREASGVRVRVRYIAKPTALEALFSYRRAA